MENVAKQQDALYKETVDAQETEIRTFKITTNNLPTTATTTNNISSTI